MGKGGTCRVIPGSTKALRGGPSAPSAPRAGGLQPEETAFSQ